ncbi:RNA polymerase sigma factor [Chitinophaga filiformis]|uniref:Sigma-70 family RNA polymerase sigma factor n=1 Tax=Chitinophaga filiformis TaxID=104663 RepID=A0ABY4I6U2_CHIFI|nr:sigma-70 family RNA polymerase sigma factor [Chitinophaga filiformis]UPK71811.1 sigma-70 family RNA polymerase sigma factor [Chitinophaga filiformis]
MTPEQEQELMKCLKEGDKNAFKTIYEEYKPVVEQSLRAQGLGENDINDILQEVFCSLWERRAKLDVTTGLKVYLIGAARKRRYTLFRNTQTSAKRHVLYEHSKGVLATDLQAKQELYELLQRQLDQVDKIEKEIFNAAYENGKKPKEIGAQFGIEPHKVRRILKKIRGVFKTYINK